MRSSLHNNRGAVSMVESLGLKAVSLLLALILWLTVLGIKTEEIETRVRVRPLLAPGTVVLSPPGVSDSIVFRVTGPRIMLRDFQRRLADIQPDYRGVQEGTVGFPVREDLLGELPQGVKVQGFSPTSIQFRLDKLGEKVIPLRVDLSRAPQGDAGSAAQEWSATPVPARVQIRGPKSRLSAIDAIAVIPTESIMASPGASTYTLRGEIDLPTQEMLELLGDKAVEIRLKRVKK